LEGQEVTGYSGSEASELASGIPRRFHPGHFRTQLGDRYYRRIREEPGAAAWHRSFLLAARGSRSGS